MQSESESGVLEATDASDNASHGADAPLHAGGYGMGMLVCSCLNGCSHVVTLAVHIELDCVVSCCVSEYVYHGVLPLNARTHAHTPQFLQHLEAWWLRARVSMPCELRLPVLHGIQACVRAAAASPCAAYRSPRASPLTPAPCLFFLAWPWLMGNTAGRAVRSLTAQVESVTLREQAHAMLLTREVESVTRRAEVVLPCSCSVM
jgi:hypothetical protein